VITDSALVNVKLWGMVKAAYPHITGAPYIPHTMNLVMEDMGKLPRMDSFVKSAINVILFLKKHHSTNSLVKKYTKFRLIRPGKTRFGTNYLAIDHLRRMRHGLQKRLKDKDWIYWMKTSKYML
jgi:hypothetical protein